MLRQILFAIGLIARALFRPAAALRAVEEQGRGGLLAAALLVFVATPIARASVFLSSVWDPDRTSATINRILEVVTIEAAVTVGLVVVVFLILRWRVDEERWRPRRDMQLGATCALPALVLRLLSPLVPLPLAQGWLRELVWLSLGLLWTVVLALVLVPLARRREPGRRHDWAGQAAGRGPATIGVVEVAAAVGLLVAVVGAGVLDLRRHRSGILPAPAFSLPRLDGQPGSVALGDLRGKVVVLDFWASWCAPCRDMFPVLEAAHQRWKERGVAFVGLACDDPDTSDGELAAFVAGVGAGYPMIRATPQTLRDYRIRGFPTLVVLRPDGSIYRIMSGGSARSLESAIAEAMP